MQIPHLKSRACKSSWGLVLSRLTIQSEKNEVKQHPSVTAQTTERHLLPLSSPLTTFVTSKIFPSHTKTRQVFQRLSQHMGETLLAGTTVLRVLREGTEWWKSRHWADSRWARARFAIVLFPGQYCCWVPQVGSLSCSVESEKTYQRKLIQIATSYEYLGVFVVAVVVSVSLERKELYWKFSDLT